MDILSVRLERSGAKSKPRPGGVLMARRSGNVARINRVHANRRR